MVNRMSRITDTALTERHMDILEFAHNYYEKNKVGPLFQNLKKTTGASKEEVESLFPHGLTSVYTWIGIPIHTTNDLCKPMATVKVENFREVYLDHNATTYVREEVKKDLLKYFGGTYGFGNPSSSYNLGKKAYDLTRKAREQVSDCIKVHPEEIIFMGCGSEANNTAIKGIAFQHLEKKGHVISTVMEHPSVLKTMKYLEEIGFAVTYLDVEKDGRVTAQSVQENLREDTILVSVMAVNNEIGTINPITEIGKICRDAKVPFMVDAIQGFGKMKLRPKEMGISLMSISGHKIYAPKGVAALFINEDTSIISLIHGGGQEYGIRSGTENVGSVMALGQASKLIHSEMEKEDKRLSGLRSYFLEELRKVEPGIIVNGSMEHRNTNNLSVGFPDIDSGSLLLSLNQIGVYVSAGSACSAGSSEASATIKALGIDTERYGIIRFSFGLQNKKEDLDYLLKYLPQILEQLKAEK